MQSEALRAAKAQLSAAHRKDRNVSHERLEELRRNYTAAKIAEYIANELEECPPLTYEQNAAILRALRISA